MGYYKVVSCILVIILHTVILHHAVMSHCGSLALTTFGLCCLARRIDSLLIPKEIQDVSLKFCSPAGLIIGVYS